MSRTITYREYTREDLPGLFELWEADAGWGSLDEATWDEWFVNTPHGESLIVVALDEDGRIIGQQAFRPALIAVGDREVRAIQISAPILKGGLRFHSLNVLNHPMVGMFKKSMELAREKGFGIVYGLPKRAFLRVFKIGRLIGFPNTPMASYKCVGAPMRAVDGAPDAGLAVAPGNGFGDEYADLWVEARRRWPIEIGVVRGPAWLAYRNGDHTTVLEGRDEATGRLEGFVSVRRDVGLIYDALARDADRMTALLAGTLRFFAEKPEEAERIEGDQIKAMKIPSLAPILDRLGFGPVDYTFGFACYPLGDGLGVDDVDTARWYVMPGD